jgi:hypothetical protein
LLAGGIVGALAFALFGILRPVYEASALLEFPVPRGKTPNIRNTAMELPAFRRFVATQISTENLIDYAKHLKVDGGSAVIRLIDQARSPGFWGKTAVPVAPISRDDRRQFGLQKSDESAVLLGLNLFVTGSTPDEAREMIQFAGLYYSNSVFKARLRSWIVDSRVDAEASNNFTGSEIIRLGLENSSLARRITTMKTLLERYPEASRLDPPNMISVNPAEPSEKEFERQDRMLSPLAQIVVAESAIAQNQEAIVRLKREIFQRERLTSFFSDAVRIADGKTDAIELVSALRQLSKSTFIPDQDNSEAISEIRLGIEGVLDVFATMPTQFGVNGPVRIHRPISNEPWFLACVGALLGLVGCGLALRPARRLFAQR